MPVKRTILLALVLITLLLSVWWIRGIYSAPPEIPFVRVERGQLINSLSTNGRAEPFEWVAVRSEREGAIERLHVKLGQQVSQGTILASLAAEDAKADLASAEAQVRQAESEIEMLKKGGRATDLAEIESAMSTARRELARAQVEHAALVRLEQKQAATRQEVLEARNRVEQAEAEIRALESKRNALVTVTDRAGAQARLEQAVAARTEARQRIDQAIIRSPLAGIVYELPVRPGVYLQPGELVASVGQIERMRVRLYVDEPELGRLSPGMPVRITWDAMPGKEWQGVVESMPTRIEALGARQVGEAVCIIENPGRELIPGTNVNAEIQTQVVENALIVPGEAVRREQGLTGVFLLDGDHVSWRPIKTGTSNLIQTEVLEGLAEGDVVALGTGHTLRDGDRVRPVLP